MCFYSLLVDGGFGELHLTPRRFAFCGRQGKVSLRFGQSSSRADSLTKCFVTITRGTLGSPWTERVNVRSQRRMSSAACLLRARFRSFPVIASFPLIGWKSIKRASGGTFGEFLAHANAMRLSSSDATLINCYIKRDWTTCD